MKTLISTALFNNGWNPCAPGGKGCPSDNEEVLAIFPVHDILLPDEDTKLVLEKVTYKSPVASPSYWWFSLHGIAVHHICWRPLPEWPLEPPEDKGKN